MNESVSEASQGKSLATFTENMKSAEAASLRNKMLEFIREIQSQIKEKSIDVLKKRVQDAIETFEVEYEDLFNVVETEGIEDILLRPLHDALVSRYPLKQDRRLEFYFRVYEFIKIEWLSVESSVLNHQLFPKAIQRNREIKLQLISDLQKIQEAKTSREKISLISSACTFLSSIVNICYQIDFREKNKLKGADQYYMASYQSSLEFIDEIDAKKLKIEEPVFEELYNKNYLKYKELGYLYDFERSNKFKNFSTSREVISIAQKEKKGIQDVYKLMLNVDDGVDQSNGNSKELKFLNQQLSNVKLYQLPDMFTEYTEMVDTYKSIVEKSQSVLKEIDDLAEDKNNKSNGKSIFRKIF